MIQVYTGNGKGKTTAVIGLAIRALGAGHRVLMMQFKNGLANSEQGILREMTKMSIDTSGITLFVAEEGMMTEKARVRLGE